MSPIGGPETSFLLNPNALGLRSQQISWVKVTDAWEGWLPPVTTAVQCHSSGSPEHEFLHL